jgi:hypothetical protein
VPQTTKFALPSNSGFLIALTPTYPFRGRIRFKKHFIQKVGGCGLDIGGSGGYQWRTLVNK